MEVQKNKANLNLYKKAFEGEREPIAIIGMGCRFPGGANSPDAFWKLLCDEVDAISEIPATRWNLNNYYDPDRTKLGRTYVRWGGFIDNFDHFDAQFFGISPREAAYMDPQQRLLLEASWEALEDAGQVPESWAGSNSGVFMGIFMRDYEALHLQSSNRELISSHTGVGSSMGVVANRISYVFNLHGPSLTLDTACSSSLVAIHLACQSIWNGGCVQALAGGANALIKPEMTIATSKASMLSPDGRCKSFDVRANGYVRAEGVGVVALKPLSQAQADGDPIYAVIRSTVVNQDGRTSGITVPNGQAQEAALREAYRRAGVSPQQVQYVEAHGTGTAVGDPIETNAIGTVLGRNRGPEEPLIIGSVKSNIGHTESAAGVAGVMKAALALKHGQIPANLHFETPNPKIRFDEWGLRVPQALEPWPDSGTSPRLAGVNSFGFGGTNAHVVLQEAPKAPPAQQNGSEREVAQLVPLSARSPEALQAMAQAYLALSDTSEATLADISYSASSRRGHHDYRLALVASSKAELTEQLHAFLEGETRLSIVQGQPEETPPQVAFVFAGMGPQWWAMGRQLLAEEPIFRETILECDRLLRPLADWSLLEQLTAAESDSRINRTEIAQPAIFSVQVALATLWRSWGIEPSVIVGHSVGEIAAAHVAGALTLPHAVRLIYHRSRLQQLTAGTGKMLAVGLSEEGALNLLNSPSFAEVSIAAINSPSAVTLAGDSTELEEIAAILTQQQVFNRLLQVEVPYHSPKMEPIKAEFVASLQYLTPQTVKTPLFSTVTGQAVDGSELHANYWWQNIRNSVRFAAAIDALCQAGFEHFLEISPHPVLTRSISECLKHADKSGTVLSSLRRQQAERGTLLASLGQLYTQGYPIDWSLLHPIRGQFVHLPTYPWQRERYWQESEQSRQDRVGDASGLQRTMIAQHQANHPLLGSQLNLAPSVRVWAATIDKQQLTYLEDHRIQNVVVFPGAAYIEMALAAAQTVGGNPIVEEFEFQKALLLPDEPITLQLTFSGNAFDIYSQIKQPSGMTSDGPTWIRHATGQLSASSPPRTPIMESGGTFNVSVLESIRLLEEQAIEREHCYQQFQQMGLPYGPTFQAIGRLWRGTLTGHEKAEAFAELKLHEHIERELSDYQLHPVLLDACLQVFLGIMAGGETEQIYLPVKIDRIQIHNRPTTGQEFFAHARLLEQNEITLSGDIHLVDEEDQLLVEIQGLHCQAVAKTEEFAAEQSVKPEWLIKEWIERPLRGYEANMPSEDTSWLIFSDNQGVGEQLASLLYERGENPIIVSHGMSFSGGGTHYQIRPQHKEDIERVLSAMPQPCRGVIHLWSLDTLPAEEGQLSLEKGQILGSISVLHLIQALSAPPTDWPSGESPHLWLVTQQAQAVHGSRSATNERLQIQQAPLWGLGQVIEQEHPEFNCVRLDLDQSPVRQNAQNLFNEIGSTDREEQVAYRDGRRYAARLGRSQPPANYSQLVFSPNNSYLITGGLGALGQQVAHFLLKQGAKHLVLSGRRGAEGKEEVIRALEAAGAEVLVVKGDVSKQEDVVRMLAEIESSKKPLRGIIHAAGVLDDGVLRQQSAERFMTVMAPKMMGAWNLHALTTSQEMGANQSPLDFFICFSSVASLLGNPGQGNYAAGNAFMDALAHHRQALGLPALSINWGPWAEVGMASQEQTLDRLTARGMGAITPQEGLEILSELLRQNLAQVGVLPINWPRYLKPFAANLPRFLEAFSQDAPESVSFLLQLHEAPESEHQELLMTYLREQLAEVLGFTSSERIKARQRLFDLGLDSLMAVELKNRLEGGLNLTLSSTLLFDYSTVQALGDYLAQEVLEDQEEEEVEDLDEFADILQDLEGLSDEELAQLLAEELAI